MKRNGIVMEYYLKSMAELSLAKIHNFMRVGIRGCDCSVSSITALVVLKNIQKILITEW
jgi:hypothetical protein